MRKKKKKEGIGMEEAECEECVWCVCMAASREGKSRWFYMGKKEGAPRLSLAPSLSDLLGNECRQP